MRAATFHRIMGWMWLAMLVPTLLWWRDSVLWVASMSLYANVASEFAAGQASELSEQDVERVAQRVMQFMRGEEDAPPPLP